MDRKVGVLCPFTWGRANTMSPVLRHPSDMPSSTIAKLCISMVYLFSISVLAQLISCRFMKQFTHSFSWAEIFIQ